MTKTYTSLSEAYLGILHDVWKTPDYIHDAVTPEMKQNDPNPVTRNRNWYFNKAAKQEKTNYSFVIREPDENEQIKTRSEHRDDVMYEYSSKETVLFDKGDRVEIKQLSKVWQRVANPDGTINASYGYMVYHLKDAGNAEYDDTFMSQWEWAKNRLLLKQTTNQAYIHFNRPKDQWNGNLDQPCCMNIQFQIRENRLNLLVNMRSNDLVYGVPYNMLYFVKLMHRMVRELKEVYPTLVVGDYYYHAASLHFYLKHLDKVEDMLGVSHSARDAVSQDHTELTDVFLSQN
jgi:thymidylate synthase